MNPLGTKLKVLCVDDESEYLIMISNFISSAGYEVLVAASCDQALGIITQNADRMIAVISDLKMPSQSGLDLRRQMLADYRNIPFIILSGYVSRETALQAVDLKVSAFVDKPFNHSSLLETIAKETQERSASIREDDELKSSFVGEAETLVEEMEGLTMGLEDNPSDLESINRIFACAHTIKGASGYFKPDTVHKFTHVFEDYFSQFKNNPSAINSHAISTLLNGLDTIKNLLRELKEYRLGNVGADELIAEFKAIIAQPTTTESPRKVSQDHASLEKVPDQKAAEIRVGLRLLDAFMERSGELTVFRNMINKVIRVVETKYPEDDDISLLGELLTEIHKVNNQMQEQITDLRKVAFKQVLKPLIRTLRDLCVSLKKQISLETPGSELALDHTLAEILSKCLIHMIRNAADHGIESPERRTALGKPPQGTIRIHVEEQNEEIIVHVGDDGKGIDVEFIKKKAVEKGVVSLAEASAMTDSGARLLIFEPGFSTAEHVTGVSGRGVGTDMVMKTITDVGGRIEVKSEVGVGTEFILRLPIPKSVLIISSLLLRVCGKTFALPQESIRRVVRIRDQELRSQLTAMKDARFYRMDNRLIPIVRLHDMLELRSELATNEMSSFTGIWVSGQYGEICLEVDEILNVEDTVVKGLGKWMSASAPFRGATFLADGQVGLIIDVDVLAKKVGLSKRTAPIEEAMCRTVDAMSSLLLFRIGGRSIFAIPQKALRRLEEFPLSKISFSGRQPVVVYRDQLMPIIDLKLLLDLRIQAQIETENHRSFQILVIENPQGRYIGFRIESVFGFVDIAESTLTALGPDFHLQNVIVNRGQAGEAIAVMLDIGSLVDQIASIRESETSLAS